MTNNISKYIPESYDFISQSERIDENIHRFITSALVAYSVNKQLKEFWEFMFSLNNEYGEAEIGSKETINIIIDTMLEINFHTEEEIVNTLNLHFFRDEIV
jgi:hypothetical protein